MVFVHSTETPERTPVGEEYEDLVFATIHKISDGSRVSDTNPTYLSETVRLRQ